MVEASDRIRRITWVGLIVNLGLSGFKFAAGLIGHSQAVVADSLHSLSDVVTDLAILLGVRHWTAPADRDHPYGHGRIETAITLFIGLSLASVAIRIGYTGLITIRDVDASAPGAIALVGALVSIVCKEVLYRWTVRQGKAVPSKAVVANAWHHRSDAFSSIPVALAVAVTLLFPRWAFVDHIGAVVVSVFIIKAAIRIGKEALYELVDAGVPRRITTIVRELATAHDEVREVHGVRARRVGAGLQVDLHLLVEHEMPILRAHAVAEDVRSRLLGADLHIIDVLVHIEPYPQNSWATHPDRASETSESRGGAGSLTVLGPP